MKNDNTKGLKRKDKKGRILRTGESQQSDGRYRYSYTINGKQKSVYSWRLEETDRLPAGKRQCVALRTQEKEIQEKIRLGIKDTEMTVTELAEKYLSLHDRGLKNKTVKAHKTALKNIEKSYLGDLKIDNIRVSDAKVFFQAMEDEGKGLSTMEQMKKILKPAFQMAFEDQLILQNPFCFTLSSVVSAKSETRDAISAKQMNDFLDFVQGNQEMEAYWEAFYILFHTGLRISEFCGLTISDVDMKERTINVNHQLVRYSDLGFQIETPKSRNGIRQLPMTDGVYKCFQGLIKQVMKRKTQPIVDGKSGFFYLDSKRQPIVVGGWEIIFRKAVKKYNEEHPHETMPDITPHICRHTCCTNMARAGISPKALQYLMGHANIKTTLNVYAHLKFDDAREEMEKLQLIKSS